MTQQLTKVVLKGTKLLNEKKIQIINQPKDYKEKSIDVVTNQEVDRNTVESICLWCKHKFNGYVYRSVIGYHMEGMKNSGNMVRITKCYGVFCSNECMFADILEDCKKIYEYRNKYYTDVAHIIVRSKFRIKKDLNISVDPNKRAPHWHTINTFCYGDVSIDKFRK